MFYVLKDEKIVLFDEDKQKLIDTLAFMPQYQNLEIKKTQKGYVIYDFELMTVKEKEAKEAQEKREKLDGLSLTAADVERAIYKAKGMDFEDIIEYITTYSQNPDSSAANIDIKALKIELKANNFYRGNPYISLIGGLLGFSETQLDEFFKTGNYSFLLPEEDELNDEIPF